MTAEQPLPKKNLLSCIQDLVVKDIETRKQVGIERYGTVLQPFNGRNAIRDAYEEALDLAMYLRQVLEENKLLEEENKGLDRETVAARRIIAILVRQISDIQGNDREAFISNRELVVEDGTLGVRWDLENNMYITVIDKEE